MNCKLTNLFAAGGAGAILLGLLAAGPAYAGTNTGSMQVSATVAGACTITANSMSFGTLAVSDGDTTLSDTSATVSYACNTTPTAFTVGTGLHDGLGTTSATYGYAMANGTSYIAYGLDVITGAAGPFTTGAVPVTPSSPDNIVGGTAPTELTGGPYTVWAEIPAGQATVAGTYDDTVTFTMTF